MATFSGMGIPAGGNPMAMLGNLFGGAAGKNSFGNTQASAAGRWVDVTLSSRLNPSMAEAEQAVPAGFLDAALKLQSPRDERRPAPPDSSDDQVVEHQAERPKGKLLLYWGCGAAVRAGQPKVLDMATASAADLGRFFQARRATQRGTHSAVGRPLWPSAVDTRMLPAKASLVGAHGYTGGGVPEGFRFQIPAAQDLMPALAVQQAGGGDGATELSWAALPTARAYFIAGMGAGSAEEMVIWTSSELPDSGFGLVDYQTNPAVDRWLGEKVLLSPQTTRCTVPKGVFPGGTGMLRVIAYGSELNLAHPPRPQDPKANWAPEWAVKIRVKSVASVMLGMPGEAPSAQGEEKPEPKKDEKKPGALDLLKGILGR